eukprot:Hpha_TRINITY_DN36725_c0_g1::TRINITY_DN36725_c0_g1_i1::g.142135::m.142135
MVKGEREGRGAMRALCAASLPVFTLAIPSYTTLVPNARMVPAVTCIGSVNAAGGGGSNPFGAAFVQGGRTWSRELCMADSDGDGYTNGQELGDPQCVWSPGLSATMVTGLSHPGLYSSIPTNTPPGYTPAPVTPAPATPFPGVPPTPQPSLTAVAPVPPIEHRSGSGQPLPPPSSLP